jgi:adenylate kinase
LGFRVVVVGIPGVGKSTVVDKFVAQYPGAKLVTFGSVMLEAARSKKWVKDRDQMRKLPVEKQKLLQKAAAVAIARMKERVVVVDTHLFIRTNEGFWPGLPFEVARAMNPTHLVLVEASPEDVAKRRMADTTRSRDAITTEALAQELQLARSFLTVASTLTGAPMLMVTNAQGKADEAASAVASMLRSASS